MLVNPPPHLSHALSLMHRDVYMHETNREGRKKSPQGGGSGGGLIGPRNAAQFNLRGVRRNPPETSIIQPTKMIYMNNFY